MAHLRTKIDQSAALLLLVTSLFIFNPFLGFLLGMLSFSIIRDARFLKINALLCSFFWALLTLQRDVVGDAVSYQNQFSLAGEMGVVVFLGYIGKEPGFYGIMYLFSNWLSQEYRLFSACSVLIVFYCVAVSIIGMKRSSAVVARKSPSLTLGMTFLFLSPYAVMNSGQFLRQYLAAALVILAFTQATPSLRKGTLLVLAFLFHTSSGFFLLIHFCLEFARKLKFDTKTVVPLAVILCIGLVVALRSVASLSFLNQIPFLGYALRRATQTEFFEIDAIGNSVLIFLLLMWIISVFLVISSLRRLGEVEQFVFASTSAIFFVVFGAHFVGANEIAVRFTQYAFLLFPLLMVLLMDRFAASALVPLSMCAILVVPALIVVERSPYGFPAVEEVIFMRIDDYFRW